MHIWSKSSNWDKLDNLNRIINLINFQLQFDCFWCMGTFRSNCPSLIPAQDQLRQTVKWQMHVAMNKPETSNASSSFLLLILISQPYPSMWGAPLVSGHFFLGLGKDVAMPAMLSYGGRLVAECCPIMQGWFAVLHSRVYMTSCVHQS